MKAIRYNHWLPKLINANAIVLFKRMYFAMREEEVTDRLMKHELEHVSQQKEEGIFFYPKYFIEYIKNLFKYRSHSKAYWYISYEIEAREAEK